MCHPPSARRELERIRRALTPRPRRWWIRPWLRRREDFGIYSQLMEELKREDVASFTNLMRVSPQMFQEIVQRLTPKLTANQRVGGRPPLPVGLKVAITLRFLATGDNYKSL